MSDFPRILPVANAVYAACPANLQLLFADAAMKAAVAAFAQDPNWIGEGPEDRIYDQDAYEIFTFKTLSDDAEPGFAAPAFYGPKAVAFYAASIRFFMEGPKVTPQEQKWRLNTIRAFMRMTLLTFAMSDKSDLAV